MDVYEYVDVLQLFRKTLARSFFFFREAPVSASDAGVSWLGLVAFFLLLAHPYLSLLPTISTIVYNLVHMNQNTPNTAFHPHPKQEATIFTPDFMALLETGFDPTEDPGFELDMQNFERNQFNPAGMRTGDS